MKNLKDEILTLAKDVISSEINSELEIYEMFESSLYDSISQKQEHILAEHSHFGGEDSITSYYILAIIAWVSNTLANEGLKIGKITLYEWLIKNKKKILSKYKEEKYKHALGIIESYLEKEIKK